MPQPTVERSKMSAESAMSKKMTNAGTSITRRRALQGAASLLGGTIATTQLGPFMARAALAADEDAAPVFFDRAQFALVERVVDLIIPETDTPGAHGAGVHHFIDRMLAEWAAPARQARFAGGVQALHAVLNGGEYDYLSLPAGRQLEMLRRVDEEAHAEGANDAFFAEFKRLVLFGYYSSEVGATVELQYEPLIPDYKACVPIDDIGRAWFWLGFSHGL